MSAGHEHFIVRCQSAGKPTEASRWWIGSSGTPDVILTSPKGEKAQRLLEQVAWTANAGINLGTHPADALENALRTWRITAPKAPRFGEQR